MSSEPNQRSTLAALLDARRAADPWLQDREGHSLTAIQVSELIVQRQLEIESLEPDSQEKVFLVSTNRGSSFWIDFMAMMESKPRLRLQMVYPSGGIMLNWFSPSQVIHLIKSFRLRLML